MGFTARVASFLTAVAASYAFAFAAHANGTSHLVEIATISVPDIARDRLNPLQIFSFGAGAVDSKRSVYILADRTDRSVDVFDTRRNALVRQIVGGPCAACSFTGVDPVHAVSRSGPNGVVTIPNSSLAWIGDVGSIKLVDYVAGNVLRSVAISGSLAPSLFRTDLGCYDERDHLAMFENPDDPTPFASVLDTSTAKIVARIFFPESLGLHDCAYEAGTGKFYVENVGTPSHQTGEIDAFDARALRHGKTIRERTFPVPDCSPHGIAIDDNGIALIGCDSIAEVTPRFDLVEHTVTLSTRILNLRTGVLLRTVNTVGGDDSIAFNPHSRRWYVAASAMTATSLPAGEPTPVIGVFDARHRAWLENIPVPPGSVSVAVDPSTGNVYVPERQSATSDGGVAVFAPTPK